MIPKLKTLVGTNPFTVFFFLRVLIFLLSKCPFENIFFSDLGGDGDFRLVIADLGSGEFNMKLRVFKGTQQVCAVSGCTRELSRFV